MCPPISYREYSFLANERTPKSVATSGWGTLLLWVASITMIVAVGYSLGREAVAALMGK